MTRERRPTSLPAGDDHEVANDRAASAPASLGGWRPATFGAGALRPSIHDAIRIPSAEAAPRRAPAQASPAGESVAAAAAPASTQGRLGGLVELFSARPQVRPLPVEAGALIEPRFETERLILRVLRVEDFDDYFAVAGDPETFKYSHRGGMTSDEAWTRLLRQVGHWNLLGWGLFAVEEKASGRFVGEVGLGDFRRGLGPDFDGVPEAGCTIAAWAQGLGYATEATQGALDWIERKLAPPRTVCLVHSHNTKSIRVAEKLGYRPFARRTYRGFEAILFERLSESS